jgi:lysophospholipase L1-like esterase
MTLRKKITILCVFVGLAVLSCPVFVLLDRALFWRSERKFLIEQGASTSPVAHTCTHTVLFIGDSILANFPLRVMFPQTLLIVNRGVRGEGIKQIADRYQKEATNTRHDVAVVEGGINDILECITNKGNEPAAQDYILASFRQIIEVARDNRKAVMVTSILPVTHSFLLPYSKRITLSTEFNVSRVNTVVRRVNSDLEKLCKEYRVPFINIHSAVTDEKGEFQRSLVATDGYHVNVFGYKAIADVIIPFLINSKTAHEAPRRQ